MRILGVDFGSTSLKAVELESTFGRFEIRDYYEHQLDPQGSVQTALRHFIQTLHKKPDRVAISLPSTHTTFRNLLLPTKDKRAIQAGVGFELEDELPFVVEESLFDYAILTQSKQGSFLHVVATLKRHMASSLEVWNKVGCDPDLITSESWAYRTLFNKILPLEQQKDPFLLLQIGHEKTNVYLQHEGNPILMRQIQWGGKDITQSISEKYQIPFDQAELAKKDHGFVVPRSRKNEISKEQADFSEILLQPLDELITEIRQVEFAGKVLTHKNISQIYLAGGTALLPGIDQVIEDQLRAPTKLVQSLTSISTSGVSYSEHSDAVFFLATSLALSLVKMDRNLTINLRKNEFSRQSANTALTYARIKTPVLGAAIVAASLTLSLATQRIFNHSKLKTIDSQLEKSIKSFFVNIQPSVIRNYLKSPTTLRQAIEKELTKQRSLAAVQGPNPRSPLDFLRTLSSVIPNDLVTDITQFKAGSPTLSSYSSKNEHTASMTFLMSDMASAERLSNLLSERLSSFNKTSVTVSPPEKLSKENLNKKTVKLSITGNPKELAYGR